MTWPGARDLFAHAGEPLVDDEVRALSALYRGRQLVRARRLRRVAGGVSSAGLIAAIGGLLVLTPSSSTTVDLVLGCAVGVGNSGNGTVPGGLDGVTLTVENPTATVALVSANGVSALAMPGRTQVTLPLASGAEVRCGRGDPLRLSVRAQPRASECTSVETGPLADVYVGGVGDLTRAQIGGLPNGSIFDEGPSAGARRSVQVHSEGRVVAGAVWHALPVPGTWQLESVTRCTL